MRKITFLAFLVACSSSSSSDIVPDPDANPDPRNEREKDSDPTPTKPDTTSPERQGTSGTRLKAVTYVAEDGAKQFIGWKDSQRNENCSFAYASDGKLRCLPPAGAAFYHADAGCTVPLSQASKGCAPAKYLASSTATNSCPSAPKGSRLLSVGAQVTPTALFYGTPQSCVSLTASLAVYTSTTDFYTVGAEVPADSFVAATESLE